MDSDRIMAQGQFAQNFNSITVPAGTLFVRGVQVFDSTTATTEQGFWLERRDQTFITEYVGEATGPSGGQTAQNVKGLPKYYSVFDIDNFILGPTPNENSDAEIHYFYRPTSIVDDSDGVTWLSTNAELTLLYGCLVEAYVFMKGEADVLQMYDKRFQESLTGLKLFGESRENTQDYRVGRVNLPKQ